MDPLSLMREEESSTNSSKTNRDSDRPSSLIQAVEAEDRRRANFTNYKKSSPFVHVDPVPIPTEDSEQQDDILGGRRSVSSDPPDLPVLSRTSSNHSGASGISSLTGSSRSDTSGSGAESRAAPTSPRRGPVSILQASQMPPPPAWLTARLPDDWDSHGRIPQTNLYMNIKTYFVRLERMSLGTLYVTNYQLFFIASRSSTLSGPVAAPLGSIERISLRPLSTRQTKALRYMIEIECKNVRTLRFGFPAERQADCNKAFQTLQSLSFPPNGVLDTFAFFHKGRGSWPRSIRPKFDGWKLYDPVAEFARMGIPDDNFRITEFNKNYEVCETYPSLLCVPSMLTEDELVLVADFRSKGRLPVLSWKAPGKPQTIWRCSQPRVGMGDSRCSEDERLLKVIGRLNPAADILPIFDCRPKINAVGNKMAGKGFEVIENYPGCKLLFMNIQNIHNVRESYMKLGKACMSRRMDVYFSSSAVNSGWLKQISEVLRATHAMVTALHRGRQSMVCHCSDGWDRTAQLVSLTQLCVDPYFRTTRGFFVLVEKEWVSFGHQFRERMGQADPNYNNDQRSPVFIQWLDAVYQLTLQFPRHFQFNSRLLCELAAHSYNCRFGTFLANSQNEALKFDLAGKTLSVWTYFLSSPAATRGAFTNPLYSPSGAGVREAPSHRSGRSSSGGGVGGGSGGYQPEKPKSPKSGASPTATPTPYPAWQDLLATISPSAPSVSGPVVGVAGRRDSVDLESSGEAHSANHQDILKHNLLAANAHSGAVHPVQSAFSQPTVRQEGSHKWRDPVGEVIYPAWSFKKLQLWSDYWLQWQSEELPLLSGSSGGSSSSDTPDGAQTWYNSSAELMEREFQLAVHRIRELELENSRLQQQLGRRQGAGLRRRRSSLTNGAAASTESSASAGLSNPLFDP